MERIFDLSGQWSARIPGSDPVMAVLPGTLDENHIGGKDALLDDERTGADGELRGEGEILTRLTRNYTYEGPAYFTRTVELDALDGARLFLDAERSRKLSLRINGKDVPEHVRGSVSTAYSFEITDYVQVGTNEIELCSDNSYTDWPHDAIAYSSAATDETQTNWSGIIGYLRLRRENADFISAVRVYPDGDRINVVIEIDTLNGYSGVLNINSDALEQPFEIKSTATAGRSEVRVNGLELRDNIVHWDEGVGALYQLSVSSDDLDAYDVRFGVRSFGDTDGRLAINGRPFFLRGEANCCEFPETGHMPMTVGEWKQVLSVFASYGVNCMRFHSHCPPDAAFTAADEMGIMMEPELSHWNPRTAFEDDVAYAYYRMELEQILRAYANHPSFVMLTLGNELWCGAKGYRRMADLMSMARNFDSTRMYAEGSNAFYGTRGPHPESDFYTSSNYLDEMIRCTSSGMVGVTNNRRPDTRVNFQQAIEYLRGAYKKPVFGFEVGQYEVLPDFDEINDFHGVTRADNYDFMRRHMIESGFEDDWRKRINATGEMSLLGYRAEVEAVMRTPGMSGLALLGIQDFPGQGTALVGMLNSHLQPKLPFGAPERFHAFFTDALPLGLMDSYTYTAGQKLRIDAKMANYSRADISGVMLISIKRGDTDVARRELKPRVYPAGELTKAGAVEFALDFVNAPERLDVVLSIAGRVNTYPIWVYDTANVAVPDGVAVTASIDEACELLQNGGRVLLTPPSDEQHFPNSIAAQFTPDFWSVGTFSSQSGFNGCMIEENHPAFASFPTEYYANWQWWHMCRGRSMVLPKGMKSIVTGLDSAVRMRNMGLLTELSVGNGRLMISSLGLGEIQAEPEARALMQSILNYMATDAFSPTQVVDEKWLREMVK